MKSKATVVNDVEWIVDWYSPDYGSCRSATFKSEHAAQSMYIEKRDEGKEVHAFKRTRTVVFEDVDF